MSLTPQPPAPHQPDTGETILEFPDNYLLIDLCGQHDRHLALIEDRLSVQILRRGNQLSVVGDAPDRERACDVLEALYQRLEAGKGLETADIDREIRMGTAPVPEVQRDAAPTPTGTPRPAPDAPVEIRTRRKTVEPRTEAQKTYVRNLMDNELAFGIGPAGTGKTYLAVAVGVSMFLGGHVDRIILSRPAVEAGERLGFLPGDAKEKVDPYMQPLYDALNDFLPGKQVQKMMEEKVIEIAPLAFMRGRTLSNAFVVLDEAQNATSMQMKMFLTRLGEGSRMVITGDRTQVDLPRGVTSGLAEAERLLKGINRISFNYFTAQDVVRHPLVAKIISAYEADEERKAAQ
ncbi:PhoH family protein [Ketogulonicigenium robustum]|uniref:PhoH-like protein n=1 Tax=Ketogulonicigenium robustum TaxID=92947 RepID=A0A1W6NXD6_9RHOB|nr:PhoH family protein [Ketogulonicigenium robustum]ARO13894.1 PhoH family protein [Ketogulonicigenium robustum]